MNVKKILISLAVVAAVSAVAVGGTIAFFSDTETSTGNTFAAGAIDLKIDNESYLNGEYHQGTSWLLKDLEEGRDFFFNFSDLKPGDWGEDTISLHVDNNDSWLCADVTLTSDDDMSSTEPELEDGDDPEDASDIWDGELRDYVEFVWWADDGDNVLEDNERPIHTNVPLGTGTVALADAGTNIWDGQGPLEGGSDRYIGKAWCFGELTLAPVPAGQGVNPTVDGGIRCNGANVNNMTQTDSMSADISFRAVQSRNNDGFLCSTSGG